jgi:hypothetical protein
MKAGAGREALSSCSDRGLFNFQDALVAPAASFQAVEFFFLLRAERNSPTIHKLQRYWHDCCCWTAKAKRRIVMKEMLRHTSAQSSSRWLMA